MPTETDIDFYDKDSRYSYTRDEIIKILDAGDTPLMDIPSAAWFRANQKKGGKIKAKTSKYSKGGGVRKSKYSL